MSYYSLVKASNNVIVMKDNKKRLMAIAKSLNKVDGAGSFYIAITSKAVGSVFGNVQEDRNVA